MIKWLFLVLAVKAIISMSGCATLSGDTTPCEKCAPTTVAADIIDFLMIATF